MSGVDAAGGGGGEGGEGEEGEVPHVVGRRQEGACGICTGACGVSTGEYALYRRGVHCQRVLYPEEYQRRLRQY
eukprot:3305955-Rhodomonas_salina.1